MTVNVLTPKPMNDHIIVLRDPKQNKSDGGIDLLDTTAERNRPLGATVLATNPDSEASSLYSPGERVMTMRMAGFAMEYMGLDATLLKTESVLAKYIFNLPSMADVVTIIAKAGGGNEASDKYLRGVMEYLNTNHIDFEGDDAMIVMEIAGYVDANPIGEVAADPKVEEVAADAVDKTTKTN